MRVQKAGKAKSHDSYRRYQAVEQWRHRGTGSYNPGTCSCMLRQTHYRHGQLVLFPIHRWWRQLGVCRPLYGIASRRCWILLRSAHSLLLCQTALDLASAVFQDHPRKPDSCRCQFIRRAWYMDLVGYNSDGHRRGPGWITPIWPNQITTSCCRSTFSAQPQTAGKERWCYDCPWIN